MFGGGIGDLLKGINLKNLDIGSIASKLINLAPDGKGKQAADLAISVANQGGSTKDVKRALENLASNIPGAKEKLMNNQLWNNIPDDKDAVVQYGTNAAKQFQILK